MAEINETRTHTLLASAVRADLSLPSRCISPHNAQRLNGLFNRQTGTANYRFGYSEPIARSGIEWVNLNLNLFLAAPARMVPGTKMVFRGLDDAGDRTNLICYLQHATNTGGQPISSDCEELEN